MKNILVFTAFQLKILWGNRKTALFLWLCPIFFLCLFVLIGMSVLQDDNRMDSFKVAIVNNDPTLETRLVIQQLTENDDFNKIMKTKQVDEEKAGKLLEENEIAAMIIIPKGFSHDATNGINTPVTVIGNEQQPLQAQMVKYVMDSAANYTSAAQSGINTVNDFMKKIDVAKSERSETVKRAIISYSLHVLGRNEIYSEIEQPVLFQESMVHYYVGSFFVLLLMIWSFIGTMLVNKQIIQAVKQRLNSLGVTLFQTTAATCLSNFILVFLSGLLLAISIFYIGNVFPEVNKLYLVCAIFTMSLLFTSIFMLIQSIVVRESYFQTIGMLIILFGAITGGHLIPQIYYPEWLQQLSVFSINTWVLKLMFLMIEDITTFSYWNYICTFLLVSFFFIVLTKIVTMIRTVKGGGK